MPKSIHSGTPWRLIGLGILLVLAILIPFAIFGGPIERWTERFLETSAGHPRAVALVLGGLLAGDMLLPVPSSLVSTACGRSFGFVGGTLVSFAGMTVSAVMGYLLGWSASGIARRRLRTSDLETLARLHGRWGVWMLAAVRPVPVLAEASVLFAGLARLPWPRALPLVVCANLAVSAVYGAIGALAHGRHATLLAFIGAAALSGFAMLAFRNSALAPAAPLDDPEQHDDDGDHQQDVEVSVHRVIGDEPQGPENDQNDR